MVIVPGIDEPEILRRLKNGDTIAYLDIYNRYHAGLYCYVLRFVKLPEIAEDIVHDVFIKLWDARESIKPELFTMGYLYRISRNQVFKMMKKISHDEQLRKQVLFKLEQLMPGVLLEEQLQWKQYESVLEHAIANLPPQRRRVFNLCRQEGKTYQEAAELLGISSHTVKEHMMLAMKSIKDYTYRHTDIAFGLLILHSHHLPDIFRDTLN
jgi:RNA polymerase sigma-70 factor (family 1)